MILYLYRKKVVLIVCWNLVAKWVKVWILVGFDDIGYDIENFGDVLSIKHKKYRFSFVILRFFSWCVYKPT